METQAVFSSEEIKTELQQVLDFSSFKNSPTLTQFLEYIVTETLENGDKHIKEYSIAVNVLKRPSSFNCNDDAIVRIHAGRLRRALSLYYATEGQSNQIYIDVPKGSYIPQFKRREKATVNNYSYKSLPAVQANPTVAIFPFKCLSDNKEENVFSLLLGEELSAELSRFQDISVIGYYSMEMTAKINQNVLEAGKLVGTDYIITGSIQFTEQRVRIRINLLITSTGEVLMTKSLDKELKSGMFEIQDEIVQSFISAIGGYYGCIFQEMAKASPLKASVNAKVREAIYSYYQYQRSFSVENFKIAVSALEEAVNVHPDSAIAMAMLGELYLDGIVLAIETISDPLEGGYKCSREALKIDPLCQHAWHTLTWVHLFKGEKESCLRSAFQCIELNPNCSVMTCGVGFVLVCVGYFEEGFKLMKEGIKLNPYYPWWINTGFSFYYIHKEDFTTAFYWAEKMNSEETFWDSLLKTVSLSYMNEDSAAKKQLSKLHDLIPETQTQIRGLISSLILSEDLVLQMILGLEKAGLPLL
jgi:TolB-like protein